MSDSEHLMDSSLPAVAPIHPATRLGLLGVLGVELLMLHSITSIIWSLLVVFAVHFLTIRTSGLRISTVLKYLGTAAIFILVLNLVGQPTGAAGGAMVQPLLNRLSWYCTVMAVAFCASRAITRRECFVLLVKTGVPASLAFGVVQALWAVERVERRGREVYEAQVFAAPRDVPRWRRIYGYITIIPPVVTSLAFEQVERSVAASARGVLTDDPRVWFTEWRFSWRDVVAISACVGVALVLLWIDR